jgi:ATP-binding cassette, subfamily B, bacterial PglK
MRLPISIQNFKRLYWLFTAKRKGHYRKLIGFGLLTIMLDLVGLALLYAATMNIIDGEFSRKYLHLEIYLPWLSDGSAKSSILLTALLVTLFIIKNITTYFIARYQIMTAYNLSSGISTEQFNSFVNRGLLSQKKVQSVDYIHELFTVPNSMADSLIMSSIQCISEILFMIIAIAIIGVIKPVLLLFLVLTILPVTLMMLYLSRRKLVKYGKEIHRLVPRMYEAISDTVHGFSDIRLHSKEGYFTHKFTNFRTELFGYKKQAYLLGTATPARVMESSAVLGLLIIAFYAFISGDSDNMIALLALFASLAFRVLPSINRIIASLNTFNAMSFMLDLLEDNPDSVAITDKKNGWIFTKELELKNITLELVGTGDVLKELNLTIKKGEMVGIKGGSGEGKTSLLNLVLNFYNPQSGEVLIDGQNVKDVQKDWPGILAYVEQDAFMLAGTINENIAFGVQDPSMHDIEDAVKQVSLKKWISGLENGLNTRIGEKGTRISAGQRQRLAIARALYSKAEVFIFDEATNALDQTTKEEVMLTISRLKQKGYTIIMASHDLSTLTQCDKIYELKQGELYEEGI